MKELSATEYTSFCKRLQSSLKRKDISVSLEQIREDARDLVESYGQELTAEVQHICLDFLIRKFQPTALVEPQSVLNRAQGAVGDLELSNNQQETNLPVKADSHQLDEYHRNQSVIVNTINTAPTEIRDNLLQRYAQQQFNQVADLLAFKETIDDEINNYFTRKLAEQNAVNTQKWKAIEEEFKVESDREVTKRQESFRSFLEDFRAQLV